MRTRRYARRRAGRLRSVIELRVAFLNVFAHGFIGRTVPVHFALGDFTQRDDGRFVLGIDQRRLTFMSSRVRRAASTTRAKRLSSFSKQSSTATRAIASIPLG